MTTTADAQALWDLEDNDNFRRSLRDATDQVRAAQEQEQLHARAWHEARARLKECEDAVSAWITTPEPIPVALFLQRLKVLDAEVAKAEDAVRQTKGELNAARAKRGRLWDERRVRIRRKFESIPLEEWAARQAAETNGHDDHGPQFEDLSREEPAEPPTEAQIEKSLFRALHSYEGAAQRWEKLRQDGATDAELKDAVGREFDISGGSGGPDMIHCSYKGGPSPAFWFGSMVKKGKPLTGKVLLSKVRNLLKIPPKAETNHGHNSRGSDNPPPVQAKKPKGKKAVLCSCKDGCPADPCLCPCHPAKSATIAPQPASELLLPTPEQFAAQDAAARGTLRVEVGGHFLRVTWKEAEGIFKAEPFGLHFGNWDDPDVASRDLKPTKDAITEAIGKALGIQAAFDGMSYHVNGNPIFTLRRLPRPSPSAAPSPEPESDELAVPCSKCHAAAGQKCRNYKGQNKQTCPRRGQPAPVEEIEHREPELFSEKAQTETLDEARAKYDRDEGWGMLPPDESPPREPDGEPWPGGLTLDILRRAYVAGKLSSHPKPPGKLPHKAEPFDDDGRLWVCVAESDTTAEILPLIPVKEFDERYPAYPTRYVVDPSACQDHEALLQLYAGCVVKVGKKEYALATAGEKRVLTKPKED